MQLPKSRAVFSDLVWLESVDSTNLELQRRVGEDLPDLAAVIAGTQTKGQGRLGRAWESPAGSSLSLSVFLKGPISEPGWLSLLAALAVTRALASLGVSKAGVKWPNDVLVDGKKISGILSSLTADGSVVLGIGLNIQRQSKQLDTAISLEELGIAGGIDEVAAAIGGNLLEVFSARPALKDSQKSSFRAACLTIGQEVRAELPGGEIVTGLAASVNDSGQLVILTPEPMSLSAADVWHLRS